MDELVQEITKRLQDGMKTTPYGRPVYNWTKIGSLRICVFWPRDAERSSLANGDYWEWRVFRVLYPNNIESYFATSGAYDIHRRAREYTGDRAMLEAALAAALKQIQEL